MLTMDEPTASATVLTAEPRSSMELMCLILAVV
jgi:hypothetical protein